MDDVDRQMGIPSPRGAVSRYRGFTPSAPPRLRPERLLARPDDALARARSLAASRFETAAEFERCFELAVAQAVSEQTRVREQTADRSDATHLGFLAHEMRNLLATSVMTFDVLARSGAGVEGRTGVLLGRSLRRMDTLIERTLAEVRLGADIVKSERLSIAELMAELEIVATFEARHRQIGLFVDVGGPGLAVVADAQILMSVMTNLVQNAFKFSRPASYVTLRAHARADRVLIEVQDQCGGLPPGSAEDLFKPFEQRGVNRTGLGLGLSISRKGVRASGGDVHVCDLPGLGCVFTIDLPLAPAAP